MLANCTLTGTGLRVKSLMIGLANHRVHILNAFLKHMIYGIVASTTNPDNFNNR